MFKRIIIAVLLVLSLSVAGFWGFVSTKYVVPILMYHSVNPDRSQNSMLVVTPAVLERQVNFLSSHQYNVISLEALSDLIRRGEKIARNTVVLTFDDGYKDFYTYAYPILKKYNLPATAFIIVGEVGRPDRLSWDEIIEMQKKGLITIGSHCLGPEPLINLKSEELIRKEIFESKKILEEKLGQAVNAFSYPEGLFNPLIHQLVIDAGYKCAVATKPGKRFSNNDVYALKRLRVSQNADNMLIFWFEVSGRYLYLKERK